MLLLDSEWMTTTRKHFCQFQKVQPLQTFWSVQMDTNHVTKCIMSSCSTWTFFIEKQKEEINVNRQTTQPYM